MADWNDEWLDRALAGDSSRPFTSEELEARNADALARLADVPGADPETLLNAVVDCFAVARGGVEGNVLRTFGPAVARFGDPWRSLLRRSGRRPPVRRVWRRS